MIFPALVKKGNYAVSVDRDLINERNLYKQQLNMYRKFVARIQDNSNPSYLMDKKYKLNKDLKRLEKSYSGLI